MATKIHHLLHLLLFFLPAAPLSAQVLLDLPHGEGCNYDGSEARQESVYSFAPSSQAKAVIDEIMNLMVLPSNFIIKAANVPNAMAQVIQGQRYILYDETFMEQIYDQTGDYWAQVAILAHEIGHHLSGHTLGRGGSRPELELQADKFSGAVLYRLGGTLEQAQSAVANLPNNITSATHPPKSARMTAIAVGYRQAREQAGGVQPQPTERQPSRQPGRKENHTPDKNPVSTNNQITLGGKTYGIVRLNGQTWMAENLNYDVGEGSWCYDNDPANCRKTGRLYTWEAAKKACREVGWRLPTDTEWREMAKQFGGADDDASDGGKAAYQALIEGGPSGFAAQLGGGRISYGDFYSLGGNGYYWSATERDADSAWSYYFRRGYGLLGRYFINKSVGLSCRCVQGS